MPSSSPLLLQGSETPPSSPAERCGSGGCVSERGGPQPASRDRQAACRPPDASRFREADDKQTNLFEYNVRSWERSRRGQQEGPRLMGFCEVRGQGGPVWGGDIGGTEV